MVSKTVPILITKRRVVYETYGKLSGVIRVRQTLSNPRVILSLSTFGRLILSPTVFRYYFANSSVGSSKVRRTNVSCDFSTLERRMEEQGRGDRKSENIVGSEVGEFINEMTRFVTADVGNFLARAQRHYRTNNYYCSRVMWGTNDDKLREKHALNEPLFSLSVYPSEAQFRLIARKRTRTADYF